MSEHRGASMAACVATREGMRLVNVKFFRGGSDILSSVQLREEVSRIATKDRPRSGEPSGAPKSEAAKINVREFVKAL